MINFNQTDLKIVGWEIDKDEKILLFVLIDKNNIDKYNIDDFMNEVLALETSLLSEEDKDQEYDELLERYGIIEVFDQEEISELTESGDIDPEDLHSSLYELMREERE
ncbi:MAG TPA: hypothetical protein VKA34_17200 [Balneolales bacterium]|nr:hypothetical protein [Balneolales bacterium]